MSKQSPLGREVAYVDHYKPELLYPIERSEGRRGLGLAIDLPFHGVDIWNAWELSWLDDHGRPTIASARIAIPAHSERHPESKSLKLYLNSFSGSRFSSPQEVCRTIARDLRGLCRAPIEVTLIGPDELEPVTPSSLRGTAIDDLPVGRIPDAVNPECLRSSDRETASESLYSHLFKSHCPITNQPDWASVLIDYRGRRINHAGLLQYLLSYRRHQGFHENCVERIFCDIQTHCRPDALSVYALYTRRGGIDINPFRSSDRKLEAPRIRTWRQ